MGFTTVVTGAWNTFTTKIMAFLPNTLNIWLLTSRHAREKRLYKRYIEKARKESLIRAKHGDKYVRQSSRFFMADSPIHHVILNENPKDNDPKYEQTEFRNKKRTLARSARAIDHDRGDFYVAP